MTDYIVLKQDHGAAWSVRGHAEASGPMVARKAVDLGDGVYLVVPRRNATFISATTDQPPPRPMSVEVSADEYLHPGQEAMVLPSPTEQAGPEPTDPEPVVA